MAAKVNLNYLQQLIRETILYPSLGTLPYTIIVFSAEEVEEKYPFQEEVAFYLAFYFWDEYNEEDLVDFYKNTKEALQLEGLQKALYVEKIILQLQNPEEYEFWLSKQIASAIGRLSGKLQPYFQLKVTNPKETSILENEQLLTQHPKMSLCNVLCLNK